MLGGKIDCGGNRRTPRFPNYNYEYENTRMIIGMHRRTFAPSHLHFPVGAGQTSKHRSEVDFGNNDSKNNNSTNHNQNDFVDEWSDELREKIENKE